MSAQGARPITFDDLMGIKRLGDPQVSPDGRWIAYVVTVYDKAKNSSNSDLWILPVTGGEPRQLTASEKSDNTPRWSPDGRRLAFISTRDGSAQVWLINVDGGEARKVTKLSTEASGVLWSPDGKYLLFTSDVYPDCSDDECNKKRSEEREKSKVNAKIFDRLLFRHWKTWKDGKRSHLFVVPVDGGTARDVTPGDYDTPPFSLGGPTDYAISPDGQEICFARNTDKEEAVSTNTDLFTVPITGGDARRITTNPGADASPQYSPDGRYIAYRAQVRAGYESDRWRLMLYERKTGKITNLTEPFDRWVDGFTWAPDAQKIYFTAVDMGNSDIFVVPTSGGSVKKIIERHTSSDVQVARDGKTLVFMQSRMTRPAELYRADADGRHVVPLSKMNDALVAGLDLPQPESVWYEGAAGARVQAWLLKPPEFRPGRKYPLLMLVHGGPQGAWEDNFGYRWNPQLFAAGGYVVLMPNPRGSTGFGQAFVDGINGDWGGKAYEDLMKGVDYAVRLDYVDADRAGAAGASYGGYMIDWIAGHTDRFKALVTHAGVFNLTSEYGTTEELWFPEWEFRGTPWTNKEMYEKWSPHNYVQNFKTPTLVTHGELDFRVPISEGLQMFTSLQRMKVPSKMLYFPDEGHWVLKPQNSELWYKTVLAWFATYLKNGGQNHAAKNN
jgi:dipeptidyl aminopeptidase/acylaminoacyl peptidase